MGCSGDYDAEGVDNDAVLKLLHHYGRYRQYIIDFAKALWPKVNWRDSLECKI